MRLRIALLLLIAPVFVGGCASDAHKYGGAGFEPYTYAACNGWMWVVTTLPPSDAVALRKLADANPSSRHLQSFASEVWYQAPDGAVQLCHADNLPHKACVLEFWEFGKGTDGWKITNRGSWDCKVDEVVVTK